MTNDPAELARRLRLIKAGIYKTHGDDEALAEAADALDRMAWRPIETAPRDGTTVLIFGPHQFKCFYLESCEFWKNKLWPVVWMTGYGEPTHWMPLPPPPEAT